MDQEIINSYSKLSGLNVSRETFSDFESYISMILEKNEKINLISNKFSEKNEIIERHIIDSAQIIDIVDFNSNTTTDIGSGSGMPGIIIAILLKRLKKDIKVKLYEKSYHKSHFLRDVSTKLNLKTEIIQKNIFEEKKLEKFSFTRSRTIGIGLNALDIMVPVSIFFSSKTFFWIISVFKFNFLETSLRKWLLW